MSPIPQLLSAAIIASASLSSLADAQAPFEARYEVRCTAPERPAQDVPPATWQAFLDAVDTFRVCTNEAMEHHQAMASEHQDKARAAVERWNQFVKTSLNAPQDFPHPGDKRTLSRTRSASGVQETHGGLSGSDPHTELRPQFEAPLRDDEQTWVIQRSYR